MKKATLITGASNGIGLELAKIYASKNHNLVLIARSGDKLTALQTALQGQYGITVSVIVKDLSMPDAALEVFQEVESLNIAINYLINNAGFGDYNLFHEADWAKIQEMMQLNMICLTRLTKLFGDKMIARKEGKILNLASIAAFHPGPAMSVYFATKAFVLHLSEALHEELKPFGISVTAFCPGPTDTGFVTRAALESSSFFNRKLPTAKRMAWLGYQALEKNKAVAVPGLMNQFQVFSTRLVPRSWTRKLTSYILSKKDN